VRPTGWFGEIRYASLLVASLLLLLFGAFSATAQAAPETIAGFGGDAGQVQFPVGTAVDQSSGDLYVADLNNFRIDKFDDEGHFLLAWGFGVRDGESAELQTCGPQATPPQSWCFGSPFNSSEGAGNVVPDAVAVDQSSHDVYVADGSKRRITKFTSSGQFIYLVGKDVNATKVALGAGATQAEKNICTAASGDTCTSGASGTGGDEFASPRSLAITPSGTVWVGDTSRLTSFDENGVPGAEINGGGISGAGNTFSLARDAAGDFYVVSESFPGVRKLEAGTGALLETLDGAGQTGTVTLDAAGNIYVGDQTSPYRFKVYDPGGNQIFQFGAGEVIGAPGFTNTISGSNAIAVAEGAERLYAASSSSTEGESVVQAFPLPEPGPLVVNPRAEDIEPTTATLAATINPENHQTTYRFEYGTSESYGQATNPQTLTAAGFDPEDVAVGIEKLIPNTTYHFRVVAENECEPSTTCTAEGEDRTFTTLPAVDIDPQWATDVTAHTAVLHAEMNPLGVEAEAWLEFGTSEAYGQVVPLANLGNGSGPVLREASLSGLQAATVYHYRFVARDTRDGAVYTVSGSDQSFTTDLGALGFQLPDGRAWEMVSPPDKHGARLVAGWEHQIQAAADGNGLAYPSKLSPEADPEGNRFPETSTSLARRDAGGAWTSRDITVPNDTTSGTSGDSHGGEYKLFSADLSQALVEPRGFTPLSPEASERTPYLRQNTEPASFRPLVTGKEPYANVPPGTEFGGHATVAPVETVGASPDFTHFALSSSVPLVAGAPPSGNALYDWTDGNLEPLSVLPAAEGGAITNASYVGSGIGSSRGAVSENGSRIFWSASTDFAVSPTALYVRDTVAAETARLDLKQPDASGIGKPQPIFQGATADGTVVFFTDPQRLTADSRASFNGPEQEKPDLYRCELPPGGISSGCATLTDLSVPVRAGESAEVQGIASGIAGDGSEIYFVARAVLDEAPDQHGERAAPGEPNLYLWQQGKGVRFVATLAEEDKTDWGDEEASWGVNWGARALSASSSPDGRYLAFMSQRSLTGYDSHGRSGSEAAQEVFRYDAVADRLECVSCNPSGARPRSATPPGLGSFVNPGALWKGLQTAAALPEATSAASQGSVSFYRPRAVLDNGRVFFNAIDSLVPADSNGQWDVYQYEPTGVGDCSIASGGASIARSGEGCVSLISSGTGEEEAAFLDASETGDDAFFWTPAQLNETDTDHEVDIYDARDNGIPGTLPKVTECLGESCQPAASAPTDATPGSAVFHGSGNVKPGARKRCPKGKHPARRKGKVRCVTRRGAHRKHHRGHSNRRAHR
jgi:hypothetical protein